MTETRECCGNCRQFRWRVNELKESVVSGCNLRGIIVEPSDHCGKWQPRDEEGEG